MTDQAFYAISVPEDLDSIREVNDGVRWLRGVERGSVRVNDGIITFIIRWNGGKRRITVATDIVAGYVCDE
jgi:hypothetical protein